MSFYYHRVTGWPRVRRGLFYRNLSLDEWADNETRFYDGHRAWRIEREQNMAGDERWVVLTYQASDGFGGWFLEAPDGYGSKEVGYRRWFPDYETARDHIRRHSWARA